MKKIILALALAALAAPAVGCTYSGASALGTDKVVIAKSGFFGLTRAVFVCKVGNDGVSACQSADQP